MGVLPRDIVTELYLGGAWRDVSGHVYTRRPTEISRARRNESAAAVEPASCELALDNRSGDYSAGNVLGPWWGSIGRNTPLRTGVRLVRDTFVRTVTGGWAGADTGQAWTVDSPTSAWNVNGSSGTVSVAAPNSFRDAHLATVIRRDVDVAVTATIPVADVTGSWLRFGLWLRGQSLTDWYYASVEITTAEAVRIGIVHFGGTIIAAYTTVAGLTHTSTQALRLRVAAEGHTLRAKVWAAAAGEPYAWQVSGHSDMITAAGHVGLWAWSSSGNTNTYPIICSFRDFEVASPRFTGEATSPRQASDVSGNDQYIEVAAYGILRRLGQGASPVQSALRRGLLSDAIATPVAYWPCEDGVDSTSMASALPGVRPMVIMRDAPQFGASTDFDASDPLPHPKTSYWVGLVPAHVSGRAQVRFLLAVPAAGIAEQSLCAIRTSGSLATWLVRISAAGDLKLQAFDTAGTLRYDSGFFGFNMNGSPRWLSVEYEQVGGNVECNVVTLEPGASTGSQIPGTIVGQTLGITTAVQIGSIGDCAVGHVSVHNQWSSLFDLGNELNAWAGETAGARIQRLCGEENISFGYVGDLADTAAMGPQRSATLVTLLTEAAEADMGTLYEPRGALGLTYRTRVSLYNQDPALTLDYSAGQVAPRLQPLPDDLGIRNDVTVERLGGSSARAVLEVGPMSVLPPDKGGIGRYDDKVTLNVASDDQLPDIAGWRLHLGTVDTPRYPTVEVTLGNAAAAALDPQILDVDVDDRLTIDHLPATQTPDQVSQLVRGYSERIGLFEHTLSFVCAPESPWRVGDLDGEARLDSDTSSLTSDVSAGAASFSVTTTDPGDLWITDPAEFPFDIKISGITITVTAISGSTSPQTFTVTAATVTKGLAAGDAVHVARPFVLEL